MSRTVPAPHREQGNCITAIPANDSRLQEHLRAMSPVASNQANRALPRRGSALSCEEPPGPKSPDVVVYAEVVSRVTKIEGLPVPAEGVDRRA